MKPWGKRKNKSCEWCCKPLPEVEEILKAFYPGKNILDRRSNYFCSCACYDNFVSWLQRGGRRSRASYRGFDNWLLEDAQTIRRMP